LLVARAEKSAGEDQDKRVTVGEAELLVHGAGSDVPGEPLRLFAVVSFSSKSGKTSPTPRLVVTPKTSLLQVHRGGSRSAACSL
jgi:hypothetical protein